LAHARGVGSGFAIKSALWAARLACAGLGHWLSSLSIVFHAAIVAEAEAAGNDVNLGGFAKPLHSLDPRLVPARVRHERPRRG
jgi:hypothetical protein